MSKSVRRYKCDECGRVWESDEEALRCEASDREHREFERRQKRWHAIADMTWSLTDEDLDAIEAIVNKRADTT